MKPYIAVAFTILLLTGGAACNLQTIAGNSPGSKVPEIKDTAVLTLNEEATCLSGPGQGFDEVGMLSAGQVAEALGKSPEGDYWVIQYPAEPATLCWVANASVVVSGNPQIVPVATPPATPTLPNSPEAGCPSPVPSGPTPVSCGAPPAVGGCPSPVPSGPTPVSCGAPPAGSGCPSPVPSGPTPVSCGAPPAGSGCPSPVPSGPTPVSCGAPPSGSGCPSPVPSGPTPVYCGPDLGSGCPPAYTGGPTLVSCPTTVP
jgi:hypothetical protein